MKVLLLCTLFIGLTVADKPVYKAPVAPPVYKPAVAPAPAPYKPRIAPAPVKSDYVAPVKQDYVAPVQPEYVAPVADVYVPENKPSYPVKEPVYQSRPAAYVPAKNKGNDYDEPEYAPPLPYNFAYQVNEENDKHGRHEVSDGSVVTGGYHVNLPDGRKQIVTYKADPNGGFVADVKYEGEAFYPEHVPYKAPEYKEPLYSKPVVQVVKKPVYEERPQVKEYVAPQPGPQYEEPKAPSKY